MDFEATESVSQQQALMALETHSVTASQTV